MDTRVDAKGKYYTQHVNKRMIPVTARIQDTIVHGTVHLTLDNRLKDELNAEDNFIAITDAQVVDARTECTLFETAVLIVNKHHLLWVFPIEAKPTSTQSPA